MNNKKKAYFLAKLLISACLIAWIVKKVNIDETLHILSSVKIPFLMVGVFWLLLDRVLMSYRWNILLVAKNIHIPFLQIMKIYFVGAFSGNFLPSSIAPDAVRAYFASKYNSNASDIVSSVFVDRLLGLISLAAIALFSILFIYFDRGEINQKTLLVVLAIFILIVILLSSERALNLIPIVKLRNFFSISKEGWIWKSFEKFYISCKEYKNNKKEILFVLLLSFIVQGLSIFAVYVLSLSVNVEISIMDLFIFVPLINILIMIPVSIGGIGIQEGAFIYYFSQIGISTQAALTVALLFRALTVAGSLPGGVFYVLEGTSFAGRRML